MKYDTWMAFLPTLLALGGLFVFFCAITCFELQMRKRGYALFALAAVFLLALVLFHYIVDAVTYAAFLSLH